MNKHFVHKNKEFKTMFEVEHIKWKYGYMVYTQSVDGRIFVTFFRDDYSEKAHFNDSGSIDLRLYTGGKQIQEMISFAIEMGWVLR